MESDLRRRGKRENKEEEDLERKGVSATLNTRLGPGNIPSHTSIPLSYHAYLYLILESF